MCGTPTVVLFRNLCCSARPVYQLRRGVKNCTGLEFISRSRYRSRHSRSRYRHLSRESASRTSGRSGSEFETNQPLVELKRHNIQMAKAPSMKSVGPTDSHSQMFDFFLVLDFEATCDTIKRSPQEIIEFPVLKVNARTQTVESTFHQYVLPQYHPQLTPFCTELTGIIQDMVDNQPHLPEVLESFNNWMLTEGLLEPGIRSAFVTCGDWDLKTMLPKQCEVLHISRRKYFNRWINIKKSFADVTGRFPKGMMFMLSDLELQHVGRHHSGIDDCHNIANILVAMLQRGYVFKENGYLL